MTLIIIFLVSTSLIILLLTLKGIDERRIEPNFVSRYLSRFDVKSEIFINYLKFKTLQIIQTLRYIFIVKVSKYFAEQNYKLKTWIIDELDKKQKIFMGRKEISKKGAVSFYIKKIEDNRTVSGKGKIE